MEPLSPAERERVVAFFAERFGITGLGTFAFLLLGKGRVHIATPEAAARAAQLPAVVAGLPCCRMAGSIKPATVLLQLFGRSITRSIIDLDPTQATEFMAGRDLLLNPSPDPAPAGFVAARSRGRVLGCGLLRPPPQGSPSSPWLLKSQVPAAKRIPGF